MEARSPAVNAKGWEWELPFVRFTPTLLLIPTRHPLPVRPEVHLWDGAHRRGSVPPAGFAPTSPLVSSQSGGDEGSLRGQ